MSLEQRPHVLPDRVKTAIAVGKVPVVISDPSLPDTPLIYLNDAFSRMTGYAFDDAVGRNCRFLQPPEGAGPVVARVRAFLEDGEARHDRFVIPNQRRDGTPFLNLVYISKLRTGTGAQLFLGSQFDITSITARSANAYDRALAADLREISSLTDAHGWSMLGSTSTLASSFETIVQAKLDG
ncbi:PAS domain-containing protein [Maribius pontilimi]|uniref:PAS domain-containing protein n=1 Tax=Palleronia pontilimi TaxID=1964209 RepID=A0A934IF08_9RHOB|nr:PAS domain-containing protein [Palleronia pontilimi]MBJ3761405.1 PAS domain-containing protein [Palleronia pontilimi]